MATSPTISYKVAGNRLRASDWNAQKDYLDFLKNEPGSNAFRSIAGTIATASLTVLGLDMEDFDRDSMHSTSSNTSRITINTDGRYAFTCKATFIGNGTGYRQIEIRANAGGTAGAGTFMARDSRQAITSGGPEASTLEVNFTKLLNTGDYIEMFVYQNSGGSLGVSPGIRQCMIEALYIGDN